MATIQAKLNHALTLSLALHYLPMARRRRGGREVIAMKKTIIAAIAAALLPTQVMSDSIFSGISSPFCLVPVKNGEPTKADLYQSFRMVLDVVVVRGLDRPIIFPRNRGGVWTIDGGGAFVPFGGDFPDQFLNEYAVDTSTGDVIGVSQKRGIFRLRRGGSRFERLYAADGKPFEHPYSAAYVARLGGTVISANSGLYLLRSSGRVEQLFWEVGAVGNFPGRVFDLPELRLLLFSTERHIYARDDSGNLTIVDKFSGSLKAARVTADGRIFLERSGRNTIVPWPGTNPTRPLLEQGVSTEENFKGIETRLDTVVKVHEKRMSVQLPPGVAGTPTELPNGVLVANANKHGLYTLNAANMWDLVDKSQEIAGNFVKLYQLPAANNALLVSGDKALFLLVQKTDPRSATCLK